MRYEFTGVFCDQSGNIVPSGTITVYLSGTTTLATTYPSISSGTVTNPMTSDANGKFQFFVSEADYSAPRPRFDIVLTKSGFTSMTYEKVMVFDSESLRQAIYTMDSPLSTSGTGEQDFRVTSIAAGSLGTTGGLRVRASGVKTGAGGVKTVRFYFGANAMIVIPAINDVLPWYVDINVSNIGATNSQMIHYMGINGSAIVSHGVVTLAVDTTALTPIKITGECANAGDTLTNILWDVKFMGYINYV